jgi:hypothetical protein
MSPRLANLIAALSGFLIAVSAGLILSQLTPEPADLDLVVGFALGVVTALAFVWVWRR